MEGAIKKVVEELIDIEALDEDAATKKDAKKPTDNPEAEDVLILDTMGFSNFGNPRYQGGDHSLKLDKVDYTNVNRWSQSPGSSRCSGRSGRLHQRWT